MRHVYLSKTTKLNEEILKIITNNFKPKSKIKKILNFTKKKQFYLLLKKNNKVLGLVRVINKKINLNNKIFKFAGISSVVVDEKFQGKGFGRLLMIKVLQFQITQTGKGY